MFRLTRRRNFLSVGNVERPELRERFLLGSIVVPGFEFSSFGLRRARVCVKPVVEDAVRHARTGKGGRDCDSARTTPVANLSAPLAYTEFVQIG